MKDLALPEIETNAASEMGPVRDDNQDATRLPGISARLEFGFLAGIADGMGGYAYGGMASQMALDKVFEIYYEQPNGSSAKTLQRGIESANLAVYQTAQRLGAGRMGTTLTTICIHGNQLHLAHIGDSRAYLIRSGKSTCLTNDHSMVGDMVRMKIIPPEKVRSHSQRSILTRAVGLGLFVQPDIHTIPIQEGDRLVLCSDGLWSVIEDHEFGDISRNAKDAAQLSQGLIDLALRRESDDNVSAVSILIHALPKPEQESLSGKKWSLGKFFRSPRAMFQLPGQRS